MFSRLMHRRSAHEKRVNATRSAHGHSRWAVFSSLALFALAGTASAQNFPSKTVRIVVPFTPGSILDTVTRFVAGKASESWGQPVILENRGGAGGRIGSEQVAKAAPDGHTLLMGSSGTHVAVVFLSKNLAYDPFKDFTPITLAVEPISGMVISNSLAAANMRELLDLLRKNPGKYSYASNGVGSVFHLTGELFKQAAGVDLVHVPLQGASDVMNAVVGGHVPIGFASASSMPSQVSGGKLKVVGMASQSRFSRMPDVPTISEGLPGFDAPGSWMGFYGPANMASALQTRIHAEFVKALNAPDVKPKLEEQGLMVVGNTPQQFTEVMKRSLDRYGRAVKLAGIQAE